MATVTEERDEGINASPPESNKSEPEEVGIGTGTTTHRGSGDASGAEQDHDHPPPEDVAQENMNKYGWMTELRDFLSVRRIELALWITRLAAVFFVIVATFPIFGSSYAMTRRALICNAVISALRLHQRLPPPYTLNKEFLGALVMEDSCHYLVYSLIFLFLGHISFTLIPIFLFASLHAANFHLQMLEIVNGPSASNSGLGYFLYSCKTQTSRILKMVASAEVCLMVLIIINVFGRNLSIAVPLLYYRFLKLRYMSKRNHFSKLIFYELRKAAEQFMASGGCPSLVARILRGFINLMCKLSPV